VILLRLNTGSCSSQQKKTVVIIFKHREIDTHVSSLEVVLFSQEKPPTLIKRFFEHEFSQMQSLMSVFQIHIQLIERHSNSVVEVMNSLTSVKNIINERMTQRFLPLKVKEIPAEKCKEGFSRECDKFCAEICLYSSCTEYLDKWMKPLEDFSCFSLDDRKCGTEFE
jgi:hypothetical protein